MANLLQTRDRHLAVDASNFTAQMDALVKRSHANNSFDLGPLDLIRRAVSTAHVGKRRRPRWVHVHCIFGLGSQSASALCILLGFDPDEIVGVDEDEE